jgi:AbrB family looped-hinge helix DNA binding protein
MTNSYSSVGMLRLKARVGRKAQVVIPQAVREGLGIRPGDEVTFHVEGGRAILEAVSGEEWLRRFLAIVPRKARPRGRVDWDALNESQYEERVGRLAKRRR